MTKAIYFEPTHRVFINTDVPLTRNSLLLDGLKFWCAKAQRESGVTPRLLISPTVPDRVIHYFEDAPLGPVVQMSYSTWRAIELEMDKLPPDNLKLPQN